MISSARTGFYHITIGLSLGLPSLDAFLPSLTLMIGFRSFFVWDGSGLGQYRMGQFPLVTDYHAFTGGPTVGGLDFTDTGFRQYNIWDGLISVIGFGRCHHH